MERKGSVVVYCIAILTDQEQEGQKKCGIYQELLYREACLSTD